MRVRLARFTVLLFSFIFLSCVAYADEIQVGFPINVEEFKSYTKARGFDLDDKDGFIENKGQNFVVYTYHTVTTEQMEIVKDATFKNLRK